MRFIAADVAPTVDDLQHRPHPPPHHLIDLLRRDAVDVAPFWSEPGGWPVRFDLVAELWAEEAHRAPRYHRPHEIRPDDGHQQRHLTPVTETDNVRLINVQRVQEGRYILSITPVEVAAVLARLRAGASVSSARRCNHTIVRL